MSHDTELDPMAPGDVLQRKKHNLFTVNLSAMQQYKISLSRLSNASSNLILEELWNEHADIIDDQSPSGVDNLAGPIGTLIPNKYMIRNSKSWESDWGSILDETDIKKCLEETECLTCSRKIENFNIFRNSKTKNNPSVFVSKETKHVFKPVVTDSRSTNMQQHMQLAECKTKQLYHSSYPSNKLEEKKTLVPTKNTSFSNQNKASSWNSNKQNPDESYTVQQVKSVFKTARDQLIASNPAIKRSLGTARKPQNKFVSPMMTEIKEDTEIIDVTDEGLKHIDPKMVELIQSEIIDSGAPIAWEDIAGLKTAKSVIQEAVVWPLLRPDIFTGLRRPPKGVLLFGPPGTGKTLIGKCVASQCRATFFNISASSLTSKWIGDGEKMVRALFAVAKCHQPAVIFIDEIDSLLTQRSDAEHEATRRIKTEFLVQFDGAGTGEDDRILIIGATNRPQELDEAARRRLVKRLYIPLPDYDARRQIVMNLMKNERNELQAADVEEVCRLSAGYSGADMRSLCSEAAMGPIRSVPLSQIVNIQSSQVRPVSVEDFRNGLQRVRPSVSPDDLAQYVKWDATYGLGC